MIRLYGEVLGLVIFSLFYVFEGEFFDFSNIVDVIGFGSLVVEMLVLECVC